MRFIELIFSALILICGLAQFSYPQDKQDKAEAAADEFISQQAKENKAKEYKYPRKILHGDLNGDGKEDIAVFYVLYELQTWPGEQTYLAIFVNDAGKYQLCDSRVIGSTQRVYMFKPIENGKILIDEKEYYTSKAQTTEHITILRKRAFILADGKIKEVSEF